MTDRFCLRTSSAIGPLWYADGAGSPNWTTERPAAYPFPSALAARLWRKGLGLTPADCRVVRVGPKRPAPPTEKAPTAAPVAPGRADGTSDARVAVSSPAARPEGSGAPEPGADRWCMGDVWLSPTGYEHEVVDVGASWATLRIPEHARESSARFGRPAANGWKLVTRAGKPEAS